MSQVTSRSELLYGDAMDHILTITMLGTGNALATRCYNTCFTLRCLDGSALMVDAGGGNGVLTQLERAGMRCEDIHDLFVTHAHTDHLLGCVWMMRMALQFRHSLHVWSSKIEATIEEGELSPLKTGYLYQNFPVK